MLHVIIYILLIVLGYDFIDHLTNNKRLNLVSFSPESKDFLLTRMFQLSFIGILLSIYFFTNPTTNTWLSVSLVQICIIVFYYINWGLRNKYSFILHLSLSLPVIIYPLFKSVTPEKLNYSLPITILALILYNCDPVKNRFYCLK